MAFTHFTFRDLRRMAVMGTLSAALLLGVAACGSGTDAGGSNPAPAAVSATATPDASMDMSTMTAPAADAAAPTVASAAGQPAAGNAVQVQATLREWGLDLSQTEVPAGAVHFVVSNTGRMAHNFTIKDASGTVVGNTPTFLPTAGAQSLDVTLKPGTYTVYCSLPGHAARGQQNTLTVK